MTDEWPNILRIVNATGCAFALYFLAVAARQQWKQWNDKTRNHWWALLGWVTLGFEGAIESYILQVEPGPRIIGQTLVVAWTLRALTIREPLQAEPSLPRKE
jgi:hypothetical protein